jgi:hypothetical protein
MVGATVTILMRGLAPSSAFAFGVKPDGGFRGSNDCKLGPTIHGAFLLTRC